MMPSLPDQKKQLLSNLSRSASIASLPGDKTQAARGAKNVQTQKIPLEPGLRVTFFFDGTGNNLEADAPNREHSNVARLFQSHRDQIQQGMYAYYIPGLGTYFRAVGDTGGGALGNGCGYKGEDRLQWALEKLKSCVEKSDGRQTLHLALFGFSRGAALARAFALRVASLCQRRGDGVYRLVMGQRTSPIRLYFMGLFDTVASVGAPMAVNSVGALVNNLGSKSLALGERRRLELESLVCANSAGAIPSSGVFDGHMDWAKDLRIPEMVEDCLHLVAAHEFRNSFPVDSVLEGQRYPSNCREMVYPGAHSNVGGGYRVGEGARSCGNGALLSMIPLRVMREEALQAGVPLDVPADSQDFAADAASRESFDLLHQRFTSYMDAVGWGGDTLGKDILSHTERYFQWRFHKIARDQKDRKIGRPTQDEFLLRRMQGQWRAEQKALSKEMMPVRNRYVDQVERTSAIKNAVGASSRRALIEVERRKQDYAGNEYFSLKARMDTLPSMDDSLLENMALYDEQLLEDARAIQEIARKRGRIHLRPHYLRLLNAYEAEQRGNGLRDMAIIHFFNNSVHDSLAGFAMDATLPSDPRVVYTGGDAKLPYAFNFSPGRFAPRSALG